MENKRFILYLFGGTFVILFFVGLLSGFVFRGGQKGPEEAIAVIEVKGTIVGGESGSSLLGGMAVGSETMMQEIRAAAEDDSIKALLLHINSPGGSSAASEAVYMEILRFKEKTGKPVLATMEDVAASGGYYIALGADEIFANPATVTGSIGVIMQFTNYQELYEKYGLKVETIKSGKYKDIGSPTRDLTKEERELLQTMVNQIYGNFVDAVAEGRGLERERILELAQGQIYTGIQAQELGLIDQLGNFWDSVDYLAKRAGIKGEPELVYYTRPTLWKRIMGNLSKMILAALGKSVKISEISDLLWIEESLQTPGLNNLVIRY